MNTYFDTSALAKRYLIEEGTDSVLKIYLQTEVICVSHIGYAEMIAVFHRKNMENKKNGKNFNAEIKRFKEDWEDFSLINVDENLHSILDKILEKYPLRGSDAIHLASAIATSLKLSGDLIFASADEKLLKAASAEHLSIYTC